MKHSILLIIAYLFFSNHSVKAQNWQINRLELASLQTTSVAEKGQWYLGISYRLGSMAENDTEFFKYENHNLNFNLVYGLYDGLQLNLAWEALRNTTTGSAKMILKKQSEDFPINITAYGAIHLNSELNKSEYPRMKDADRLSYTTQILMSHIFKEKFLLEIAPTFVRQNLVWEPSQNHNQMTLGIGGSFRITESISFQADYVIHFNRNKTSIYKNPLSAGVKFNLGSFSMEFVATTAQSFNVPGIVSNGEGQWNKGAVFPGINLIKVF